MREERKEIMIEEILIEELEIIMNIKMIEIYSK
jgi:hypothetical protein